jgi:acyl-CoA synthetase (AMP-forming)/AMP-acid ligase II
MLYERWRQIADEFRAQPALIDWASSQQWTFEQLAQAAETAGDPGESIVFPEGLSVAFIVTVLRGWRLGAVVCPLERDQPRPIIDAGFPSGIVHLKTTSASTDTPKSVAFTANQLLADTENIVSTMGLRRDWPNLGVISLAHSYGFSNLVLPLLLDGIPLVLAGAPLPEAVKRAALGHSALTLAAVPALWRAWHQAGTIPPNVRLAISAGAALPLPLENTVFETCRLKIHNFYGSSECGGIAFDSSAEPRQDEACVGTPLRNVNLSVAEDGCLVVRGAAVAQMYWPQPSPVLGDGCFKTNDIAELVEGSVYLRGRASDQINVAGRKVLPESIEKVLVTHPGVHDCLAFAVSSSEEHRDETIVACVAGEPELTADVLRQYALGRLPAWQVPREWWLVSSLQVNGRGKLSRSEWKKRYLGKRGLVV